MFLINLRQEDASSPFICDAGLIDCCPKTVTNPTWALLLIKNDVAAEKQVAAAFRKKKKTEGIYTHNMLDKKSINIMMVINFCRAAKHD